MKTQEFRFLLGLLAALGVLLRVTDLGFPDFATDEAQAALGASAAWMPLATWIPHTVITLLGQNIVIARGVSVIFGIACLPLIYVLTLELTKKRETALLATAIASLFPTHILFSRLAYPSMEECFFWLLLLLCFLRARKNDDFRWYLALFFATVLSTMTKTQDILFPAALILGRIVELRTKVLKDTLAWTIAIACIPFTLYVATKPGIAATLTLYGGNMYGVSGPLERLITLLTIWWKLAALYVLAIIASIPSLRLLPWPFHSLLATSILIGYLLGPGHEYYATHLVFFSIPIAIALMEWKSEVRILCLSLLVACTLVLLGPRAIFLNRFTHDLYLEPGFWNLHAAEINEALKGEKAVTVLGEAGHHLRWYLEPEVLVGKNMTPPYPTKFAVLLNPSEAAKTPGAKLIFAEEMAAVVQIAD